MAEMSVPDALAFLGVDRAASREALRQAYLRLLKQHKPDRDPAGFARLRQAYELACATADAQQMWDEAEDPFVDRPLSISLAISPPLSPEYDPPNLDTTPGAAAPAPLPFDPSHEQWAQFFQHYRQQEYALAADAARAALQSTQTGFQIAPAPIALTVHVALALLAAGQSAPADALFKDIFHYLAELGDERVIFQGDQRIGWMLAKPLGARADLPMEIRGELARAILAQKAHLNSEPLKRMAKKNKRALKAALKTLSLEAKPLAMLLNDVLAFNGVSLRRWPRRLKWRFNPWLYVAFIGFNALFRLGEMYLSKSPVREVPRPASTQSTASRPSIEVAVKRLCDLSGSRASDACAGATAVMDDVFADRCHDALISLRALATHLIELDARDERLSSLKLWFNLLSQVTNDFCPLEERPHDRPHHRN